MLGCLSSWLVALPYPVHLSLLYPEGYAGQPQSCARGGIISFRRLFTSLPTGPPQSDLPQSVLACAAAAPEIIFLMPTPSSKNMHSFSYFFTRPTRTQGPAHSAGDKR